ncbi:MAG: hypothetical protein J0H88_08550 [Sphingomonadales bacterium]|nr:hypothetical protein [Sphingomonadales bacterium]
MHLASALDGVLDRKDHETGADAVPCRVVEGVPLARPRDQLAGEPGHVGQLDPVVQTGNQRGEPMRHQIGRAVARAVDVAIAERGERADQMAPLIVGAVPGILDDTPLGMGLFGKGDTVVNGQIGHDNSFLE